jgi:hypothetical protein
MEAVRENVEFTELTLEECYHLLKVFSEIADNHL